MTSTAEAIGHPDPWRGRFGVAVIAHRGFSGKAPENTLAAFRKAVEIGADMIEFDVRFCRDGRLVVFHDDTLERTTSGKGRVADFTFDQLRQLDAGAWFGPAFTGERIPSLKEVLDLSRGSILNIELKKGNQGRYSMLDLADQIVRELSEAAMERQVLISSFDLSALGRILQRNLSFLIGWITDSIHLPLDPLEGKALPFIHPRQSLLNEENLLAMHKEGTRVNVWTVNKEQEMERFISMGVDGIITDHPDRLIDLLRKKERAS